MKIIGIFHYPNNPPGSSTTSSTSRFHSTDARKSHLFHPSYQPVPSGLETFVAAATGYANTPWWTASPAHRPISPWRNARNSCGHRPRRWDPALMCSVVGFVECVLDVNVRFIQSSFNVHLVCISLHVTDHKCISVHLDCNQKGGTLTLRLVSDRT